MCLSILWPTTPSAAYCDARQRMDLLKHWLHLIMGHLLWLNPLAERRDYWGFDTNSVKSTGNSAAQNFFDCVCGRGFRVQACTYKLTTRSKLQIFWRETLLFWLPLTLRKVCYISLFTILLCTQKPVQLNQTLGGPTGKLNGGTGPPWCTLGYATDLPFNEAIKSFSHVVTAHE